jgi:hypothetical protein
MKREKIISVIALALIGGMVLVAGSACSSLEKAEGVVGSACSSVEEAEDKAIAGCGVNIGSCVGDFAGCVMGAACTACVGCTESMENIMEQVPAE